MARVELSPAPSVVMSAAMRCLWPLGLALSLLAACSHVPHTGRSQLLLISTQEEAALGAQAFATELRRSRLATAPAVTAAIEEVGQRLARAADQPHFAWQFVALDAPEVQNAFCLPGGKVAVYTGLFPIAESTNGLAVVMGHEIAHAIARHGAERMSQQIASQAGGVVLAALFGGQPGADLVLAAYGVGTEVGLLLPYGRAHELEADRIGLTLMARAGYDPRGATAFWQRMERASGGDGPPVFLSTHPSDEARARQITHWLGEALPLYEAADRAPQHTLPSIGTSKSH
jgi:predicted Zn-dependent protease